MSIKVTIEGGREFERNLRALEAPVRRARVVQILLKAAEPIRDAAAQFAPREPGAPDLAEHLITWVVPVASGVPGAEANDQGAVGIGPEKPFFYDYFLEYGTSKMGAQPFWRPAFDQEAPTAFSIVQDETWAAITARVGA